MTRKRKLWSQRMYDKNMYLIILVWNNYMYLIRIESRLLNAHKTPTKSIKKRLWGTFAYNNKLIIHQQDQEMYILVQRKSEASDMHNNDKDRHAALFILEVCVGGGGHTYPKAFNIIQLSIKGAWFLYLFFKKYRYKK